MANLSSLSKEELIEVVRNSSTCRFVAVRNKQRCNEAPATEFGFCKKHKNTVQGRKALNDYQQKRNDLERQKEAKIKEVPKKKPQVENPPKVIKKESQVEDSKKETEQFSVLKHGVRKPATIKKVIKPNHWGRFEDTDTHIVFDPNTKCAYGIQDPGGELLALSNRHIKICKLNGWDYISPDSDDEVVEEKFESDDEQEEWGDDYLEYEDDSSSEEVVDDDEEEEEEESW